MAHDHGKEYQVKVIHENGTEELSGWMDSERKIAELVSVPKLHGKMLWLQARSILCSNCLDKEQRVIVEIPLTRIQSQRYKPTLTRMAVGK